MIPKPLARRLDRLAYRAHAFHRYAHHPLCREYAAELIPLGRRARICRGCTYVLLGLTGGLAIGPTLHLYPVAVLGLALALCAMAEIPGVRWKVRTRLAPAIGLGAALAAGVSAWNLAGGVTALAAVGLFTAQLLRYRRRGPHRGPCQRCPERTLAGACRGFAPIVRREHAWQRIAGRMIAQGLPASSRAQDGL